MSEKLEEKYKKDTTDLSIWKTKGKENVDFEIRKAKIGKFGGVLVRWRTATTSVAANFILLAQSVALQSAVGAPVGSQLNYFSQKRLFAKIDHGAQ